MSILETLYVKKKNIFVNDYKNRADQASQAGCLFTEAKGQIKSALFYIIHSKLMRWNWSQSNSAGGSWNFQVPFLWENVQLK